MIELKIEGMTCNHCRKSVQDALERIKGVEDVQVDLEAGLARVRGTADVGLLVAAVEEEGYSTRQAV